ncbi:MAG: alpha/beta hydrolase family protein [Erysipelotrichaceae bacterium]
MKQFMKIFGILTLLATIVSGCSNQANNEEEIAILAENTINYIIERNFDQLYDNIKLTENIEKNNFSLSMQQGLAMYTSAESSISCELINKDYSDKYQYNYRCQGDYYPFIIKQTILENQDYSELSIAVDYSYLDSSYQQEEIKFNDLSGYLMLPHDQENYDVVILVGGSGPTDKDSTIGPNKLFLEISEHLASNGIASFRFNKRGLVAPETLNSELTVNEEFVNDVIDIYKNLNTNDNINNIYILGHSLGAMLIPRIAEYVDVDGYLMLAAPAIKLQDLMVEQTKTLMDNDQTLDSAQKSQIIETYQTMADNISNLTAESDTPTIMMFNINKEYWLDLNDYDQVSAACNIEKPVFIVNGESDYQVPLNNFEAYQQKCISANFTFKKYPETNHIFTKTGIGPSEYLIKSNVNSELLNDIVTFIKEKN